MKHSVLIISAFCLMVLMLVAKSLWAVTYAYIPSYGVDNDFVIRIDTRDPTTDAAFDSVSIDDTCGPYGVAVTPDGRYVLVTCADDDSLVIINGTSFTVRSKIPGVAGSEPRGVAVDPGGNYAYVADYGNNTVVVASIDDPNESFIVGENESLFNGPIGVTAIYEESTEIRKIYVTNNNDGTVTVINHSGTDDISTKSIANIGTHPVGVAATPDGRFIYVASQGSEIPPISGSVVCIRTSDDVVVTPSILTGSGYWGVAVGSQGDYVYTTNASSNIVTVIQTTDNSIIGNLNVGHPTYGVAAPKNGDFAYAVNQDVNSLSKINILATPPVTAIPNNADRPLDTPVALGAFIGGLPPSPPSELAGTASSYDRIHLTWADHSSDELGFKIERRVQGDTNYAEIVQVGPDITTYEDSGLAGNTTYEYRIRAFNEAADSSYTTTSSGSGITTEEGRFAWCFIGTLLCVWQ